MKAHAEKQNKTHRILVAPLDWGLGHATRVIPLIRALQGYGHYQVVLGVSGASGRFLEAEFPELERIELAAATIRYSRSSSQVWAMALQIPRLIISVFREHQQLKHIVETHGISAVISDNRYGLYLKGVPSVLILHQLNLLFPRGLNFWARILTWLQHHWIRRFDQVWVPDLQGDKSVAGWLSAAPHHLRHVYHIGLLSRFFYGSSRALPMTPSVE